MPTNTVTPTVLMQSINVILIGKYSIPVALRHGHSYFLKVVMNDNSFALIGLQLDDHGLDWSVYYFFSAAFITYNLFG